MDYLPLFLKITGKPCLVVGGGEVAARKASLLLEAGAQVAVLAPELSKTITRLAQQKHIRLVQKCFQPGDLEGFHLVVSATDQAAVNSAVAAAAQERGIPVNVVDRPDLCSFIFPSIIDRSPIIAAVSSGGSSPILARLLRARLETLIPSGYGKLAALAQRFREPVKKQIQNPRQRRRFWERVLQGPIADLVLSGRTAEAEREIRRALETTTAASPLGDVALVGAGPGDPDLLTFRALRLMQEADVVVYDRLVSPEVLKLVRREAEKIYAGKARRDHSMPQEEINRLLARLAREGKRVVRLKGGDPFIFGRGGEEIETLMEQGIHFQIVPGITAASGCASYAGIPLTHRDYAQSCTFVTGHLKDDGIELDWEHLALPRQTLVIYMGLVGLEKICRTLIDRGRPKSLPAAIIQQGTTAQQRVLTGTLETLPGQVKAAGFSAPTLIIIGEVVSLQAKLAWFNPTPNP